MLKVADSSSFSLELTSEDELLWNEETDKNSSLPLTTMKRVLRKLQDLSLLSGNKTLQWQWEGKQGSRDRGTPSSGLGSGNLEVSRWFFQQLAFSYQTSHVKCFILEQKKKQRLSAGIDTRVFK